MRAAVIGAGPSGFYLTGALLSHGFAVDLFDQLPTPYGLVRAGVAPDHPKIKSVARVFAKTAEQAAFTPPELVELTELQSAELQVDPDAVDLDPVSAAWLDGPLADSAARRNIELLREHAARPRAGGDRSIALRFLRSPVAICGET